MAKGKMYYDRVMNKSVIKLLGNEYHWLIDFVKQRDDLDFQTGSNYFSIYRGTTRILKISSSGHLSAHQKYIDLEPDLYKKPTKELFDSLIFKIKHYVEKEGKRAGTNTLWNYYDNKKEGFYQNKLSRQYGVLSNANSEFVIIDKETVIGYKGEDEYSGTEIKKQILNNLKERYRKVQRKISLINEKEYGKKLNEKPLGNKLDFLALDKNGNILLIEFKHGGGENEVNTSGIYLSPIQIGLYYDIFTKYHKEYKTDFEKAIFDMLEQKQKLGLISPDWKCRTPIKAIIPILIISEYNGDSSAKRKFEEIMKICREDENFGNDFLSNIEAYNYTDSQLKKWE